MYLGVNKAIQSLRMVDNMHMLQTGSKCTSARNQGEQSEASTQQPKAVSRVLHTDQMFVNQIRLLVGSDSAFEPHPELVG